MSKFLPDAAQRFAQQWIDGWNAHDIDAVLEHYAEDFEFSSPYIATIAGYGSGTLKGKDAIREYWTKALERIPELHFQLVDIMIGIGCVTLYYQGHRGMVAETFLFDTNMNKVTKAWACYSVHQ